MEPLYINFALWLILFCWYFFIASKCTVNLGVLLIAYWTFTASGALLYVLHPNFIHSKYGGELSLEPFLFLFLIALVAFLPILHFHEEKAEIEVLPFQSFSWLVYLYIFCAVCVSVMYFPMMLESLFAGIGNLRDEINMTFTRITENALLRVLTGYYGLFSLLITFLLFYIMAFYHEKKMTILLLAGSIVISTFSISLALHARVNIVSLMQNIFIAFIFFREKILWTEFREYKWPLGIGISACFAVLGVISFNRFSGSDFEGLFGIYRYIGEGMTNFNIFLYNNCTGYTYGYSIFPTLASFLGMDTYYMFAPILERGAYFNSLTGLPPFLFYTYIGELYYSYGKELTVCLVAVTAVLMLFLLRHRKVIHFHQLILFQLYYELCLKGVYFYTFRGYNNERMILFSIILYLFFYFVSKKQKKRSALQQSANFAYNNLKSSERMRTNENSNPSRII